MLTQSGEEKNKQMGLLAWIILGGGAAYLFNLHRAGEKISVTVLNISKVKTSLGAITVFVNVAIDNPTGTSFRIKRPNLKLYMNGEEVGNSIPDDELKQIEPNARTVMNEINVQIPYLNLPSSLSEIIQNGLKGQKIKIIAETTVNGIPYRSEKFFEV